MPSPPIAGKKRGFVVPIGGAEDKMHARVIHERFLKLSGKGEARIVIIPTASRLKDTGDRYVALYKELGAGDAVHLPILRRSDCEKPEYLNLLETATGVFLTGGNQLRLTTIMGGTTLARNLRRLNAQGVHVAGTSAGAGFLSEHMIAGGSAGATPTQSGVILAPGLGLTNAVVIDQHFRQRDRLGRLLTALSYNPFAIGMGLDEDTAAFLGPNGVFEVVGSGGVTVVDPSTLEYSSMASAAPGQPVSLVGLKLHILTNGARFDTKSREAKIAG
ncbi:MAG: cyanophycinase [Bacteroidetes bacterium]|nr:cyanophycinase [Bacteroidota bacterium]